MELFMRNIDWDVTKRNVEEAVAFLLHGPSFGHLSATRLNFNILLHRDKSRIRNHSGSGFLTLPRTEVGERFLELHGSNSPRHPVVIGKKTIFFSKSNRPDGRTDVISAISLQPYVDPRVADERKTGHQEIDSGRVLVDALQFGWECRDQVFSIECEELCEGRCNVSFNSERREIRVSVTSTEDRHEYVIAIPYSHIQSVTGHAYLNRDHVLVFSLNTPPAYERVRPGELRERLPYLPFILDHERVAPYASLAIRLVCRSDEDITAFRRLCSKAQFRRLYDYDYPVERRDLFSSFAMEQLQTYIVQLDWSIAFQIESMVRKMVVDVREAVALMPTIISMVRHKGKTFTAATLRKFRDRAYCLFSPDDPEDTNILQVLLDTQEQMEKQSVFASLQPYEGSLYNAFHVMVTPTTFFLDGPFPERSNRIIRAYDVEHQECFLRVSFVDEAKLQYRFDREVDGPEFIHARLGPLLYDGLQIAGRTFEFLAYSQSALKDHSVWFVKRFEDSKLGVVDASTIIASIGNFDGLEFDQRLIYCPARYAARISQAFTATDAVEVEVEEIFKKEDVETADGKYQFTDGVGTMSKDLAREIWRQLKKSKRKRNRTNAPSAFQVRFMGSKGMLSVDHLLSGFAICLRPSMIKFETHDTATHDVEVARSFDRPGPYFLNRPLIMLLEGLGVPYHVFKEYQDIAVIAVNQAAGSLGAAANLLETHGLGGSYKLPSLLHNLEKLYVNSLPGDAFYEKMLEYAINHVLRLFKNHARIPIPGAWTLVGVADVHGYLKPNEIFACIKPLYGPVKYLEGDVLISRSPTIHPGDVTIVQAIGVPPLDSPFAVEALPNTVVFSIQGERPVPSCLGGGDLDGDVYNLIPLDLLPEFRPTMIHPPADYDPAPKKFLNRPSTMDDVADFFMEYISSDVVGIIAINWLIIADQSTAGIFDSDCLKLATLHSNAVDYPKSGQPVALTEIPRLKLKTKPDWNAPETMNISSGDFYESKKAIGRLFRDIDLPIEQELAQPHPRRRGKKGKQNQAQGLEDLEETFSQFSLNDAREDHLFSVMEERVEDFIVTDTKRDEDDVAFITQLFSRYASELRAICITHTLSHARTAQITEEEAVIGTIAQKSSQQRKRKDTMSKLREATDVLVRGILHELGGDDTFTARDSLERAWMAWKFCFSLGTVFGAASFKLIALGAIFDALREIEEDDKRSQY